jgi:hypothetical protein
VDQPSSFRECDEEFGAEVLGESVGGAGIAGRLAQVTLDRPEESLELVRRRGNSLVVETNEEMGRVASRESRDVVYEILRGRSESGCFELRDVGREACLGLARVGRTVGAILGRRYLVREVAKDLRMTFHAVGSLRALQVRRESLGELVEERNGQTGDVLRAPPLVRSGVRPRQPLE